MSIKKELLSELTEKQLKQLAEYKGINLDLSNIQKKYYEDWNEKDKMVDLIADSKQLTVSEIEKFIVAGRI